MPLSPRTRPQVGWTGEEVLVIGGDTAVVPDDTGGGPSDPAADGAAYDPDTDTWRTIAEAPEPIPYYFRSTMVGHTMVIQTTDHTGRESGWLAYDAGEDTWTELPDSPQPNLDTGHLSAADGRVVAVTNHGVVQVLDVAAGTWSELPQDTLSPRLRASEVLATDIGTFLCGDETEASAGDTPQFVRVDQWDGSSWTKLAVSNQVGCVTHWTGARLVNADIQTATGLDGDPPYGGRLEPATGEWSALPSAPGVEDDPPDSLGVSAADGPLIVGWGYVYDDDLGTWTPIGRPDTPVDGSTGATWAANRLVVVGGRDENVGYKGNAGLSSETWVWTPSITGP